MLGSICEERQGLSPTTNCHNISVIHLNQTIVTDTYLFLIHNTCRPDALYSCPELFQDLHLFDRNIVRHDNAALVAPMQPRLSVILQIIYYTQKRFPTHLAFPTVANEIPVLPTVPSKSTDPVLGYRRP